MCYQGNCYTTHDGVLAEFWISQQTYEIVVMVTNKVRSSAHCPLFTLTAYNPLYPQ